MAIKFLNSVNADSGVLYVNAANDKVGIGTVAPSAKLHIVSSGTIAGSNLANAGLLIGSTTVGIGIDDNEIVAAGSSLYIGTKGAQDIYFRTQSTSTIVTFKQDGKVGIGVTLPEQKLHVSGNILLQNNNEIRSKDTTSTQRTIIRVNSSNELEFGWSGAGPVKFMGGGSYTERMRVHTDGNVGIGTTSPDSLVEIENGPAAQSQSRMLHIDNNPTSNQGSGYIEISSGSNNQAKTQIEQVSSGGYGLLGNNYIDTNIINRGLSSSPHGNINFATGSSTSATSIVMTIGGGSSKGKVGIGTTEPLFPISVQESQASANNRIIANFSKNASGNQFGSTIVRVGRTQLTSTNPGDDVQALDLEFNSGGGGPHRYGTYADGIISNGSSPTNGPYGSLHFATTGAIRMTIGGGTIAGNVGIGTTSPAAKLVVAGTAYINQTSDYFGVSNTKVQISGGSSSDNVGIRSDKLYLYSYGNGTDSQLIFGDGNAHWGLFANDNRFALYNHATATTSIHVSSAGNVGIGTTSPGGILDVDGTYGDLKIGDPSVGSRITYYDTTRILLNSNHIMFYTDNLSERMRLTSGGQLIVGGTTVGYAGTKLQVGNTSDSQNGLNIITSNTGYGYILFGDGTGADTYVGQIAYNHANDFMSFNTGGAERFRILNGNLYLNTYLFAYEDVSYTRLYRPNGSAGLYLGGSGDPANYYDNDHHYFRTAGATNTLGVWNSTGLGIGTTSPSQTFTVEKNSGIFRINTSTSTYPRIEIGSSSGTTAAIFNRTNASQNIIFGESSDTGNYIFRGGNVGIGTTSPNTPLNIETNTTDVLGALKIKNSGTGDASMFFTVNAAGTVWQLGIDNSDGDKFKIGQDNLNADVGVGTKLTIDTSGRIGMGTASPNHRLDIYSNENVPLRIHRPNNANLDSSGAWGIGFSTRADGINSTTDTRAGIFSYYNGNLFLAAANTSIVADPDAYARLTVLNTGNVGIGTASPSEKLHVNGNVKVAGSVGVTNIVTNRIVKFNGSVLDDSLLYDNGTNVGIGTTSPATKLHTVGSGIINTVESSNTVSYTQYYNSSTGTTTTNDGLTVGLNGLSAYVYLREAGNLVLGTSDTEQMRITADGRVGIGTTSPSGALHVRQGTGDTITDFYTSTYGTVTIARNHGSNPYIQTSFVSGQSALSFYQNSNLYTKISVGDSYFNGGNVGIGTTSPAYALTVHKDLGSGGILAEFKNSNTTYQQRLTLSFNSSKDVIFDQGSSSGGTVFETGNRGHSFAVNGTTNVVFNGSGDVGIGTTSPIAKLDVRTDTGVLIKGASSTNDGRIALVPASGGRQYGLRNYGSSFGIKDESADVIRMYFHYDGNTGIGTTAPSEKLEVNGNVKASNLIADKGAGIYTFSDTVNASSSEDIFSITNSHGAQAFRVTFVSSTSGYSVAKTYEVVHSYGNDPVFFKVVDTGAYNGHDFDVSFTNLSTNNNAVVCAITNNSASSNADIVTTVFLGGSPTTISVTAL